MFVSDILTQKGGLVFTVTPGTTVAQVAQQLSTRRIGSVLVMGAQDEVAGIVSERDYARKVILKGKASRETLVREIMSSPVICVHPQLTVEETMALMTEKRVRHLPVTVGESVVGVILIGDVLRGQAGIGDLVDLGDVAEQLMPHQVVHVLEHLVEPVVR